MHVVNVNCVLSFCVLLLHTDRGDTTTFNRLLVLLICLQLILRKFCNFCLCKRIFVDERQFLVFDGYLVNMDIVRIELFLNMMIFISLD